MEHGVLRMRTMLTRSRWVAAAWLAFALIGCTGGDGWREFRSVDGGFSITVPGRPEQQSQRTATAFGTIEAFVFLVEHEDVANLSPHGFHTLLAEQIQQLAKVHGGVDRQTHFVKCLQSINGLGKANVLFFKFAGEVGDLVVGFLYLDSTNRALGSGIEQPKSSL